MKIFEVTHHQGNQDFISKFGYKLYRGVNKPLDDGSLVSWFFRSAPRDSMYSAHDYANILSNKKFSLPLRNCVFATMKANVAEEYGNLYAVVPAGEYKIFLCQKCGFTDDADMNAATNHLVVLPYINRNMISGINQKEGFYWNPDFDGVYSPIK